MRVLLSGIGVLASLMFVAASMAMNYAYGISLGRNAFESHIWGAVSIASDALKALSPFFLFWAFCNQRWGTCLVCVLVLVVTTGYALQSAAGFASESKSGVIGARENVRTTYLEIENDLADAMERRQTLKGRSAQEVNAEIAATLSRVVKDGERVRGSVASLSRDCTRIEVRTAEACVEIGKLRRELAAAEQRTHLDERITALREQARELRDKGGGVDPHPQTTLLSWLTFGRLSRHDIEAGKSIYQVLLVELASVFGLLISLEHGALRTRWKLGSDTRGRGEPERAAPRHSPPLPAGPRGGVGVFLDVCVSPAPGSEVEVGDLFAAYQAWCARSGDRGLSMENFADDLAIACETMGVRISSRGSHVFCVDVKLM
jgi:hypothetical protein